MSGFKNIIGLDISDNVIYAVEFSKSGDKIQIKNLAQSEIESGIVKGGIIKNKKSLSKVIVKLLSDAKPKSIRSEEVIASIPEINVFTSVFNLPRELKDEKNIKEALEYQAREIIPILPQDSYTDFQVIGTKGEKQEIFYVTTSKKIVEDYKEVLLMSGLKPVIFDMESAAMARSLIEEKNKKEPTLILDIGGKTTIICIVENGVVQTTYNISKAGDDLTKAISQKLDVSPIKAERLKKINGLNPEKEGGEVFLILQSELTFLLEEVKKSIKYYEKNHKKEIKNIILAGGSSQMPQLVNYISSNLSLLKNKKKRTVAIGNPFGAEKIKDKTTKSKKMTRYAVAVGLAMRPLFPKKYQGINFLPQLSFFEKILSGITKEKDKEKLSWRNFIKNILQRFKKQIIIVLASGIIMTALIFVVNYWFANRGTRIQREIPEEAAAEIPQEFSFNTFVEAPNEEISEEYIEGSLFSQVYEKSDFFTPEEAQDIEGVAEGVVTLINETLQNQILVATTRLLSEEGVLFRLQEQVIVPANGEIEAEVYADEEGVLGDISPTTFTIPGLSEDLQEIIYARSDEPMSGGLTKVGVIQQSDVDTAINQLSEEVINQAIVDLRENENNIIFPELVSLKLVESTIDEDVGDEVFQFEVGVNAETEVLAITRENIINRAQLFLQQERGIQSETLENYQLVILETNLLSYDESLQRAELEIKIQVEPR